MSWWDNATTEQRLAQIDGGIECGISSRHVAKNCGIKGYSSAGGAGHIIRAFAREHGRFFRNVGGFSHDNTTGEKISLFHTKLKINRTHTIPDEAFSIFGDEPQGEILSWRGS